MGKSFGQPKSKILYVFDPKKMQNDSSPVSGLATYLEKQLGELLPMLGIQPISVSTAPHRNSAAAGCSDLIMPNMTLILSLHVSCRGFKPASCRFVRCRRVS